MRSAEVAQVALREDSDQGSEVYYILTDHLGSTALTYRASDGAISRQWYKPWGETRQVAGQMPTDYTFQGQRDSGWGLKHFGARWLDSVLGRFAQADSIIPSAGNPLAWDRYASLGNNPVKYLDPSGHMQVCADGDLGGGCGGDLPKLPIPEPDYLEHYKNSYKSFPVPPKPAPAPPEVFDLSRHIHRGFHIGPTTARNIPDYYSDYPGDPTIYCYGNPFCIVPVAVDLTLRFPIPGSPQPDDNFWIDFEVTYNEIVGITVSDIKVETYYLDPVDLIGIYVYGGNASNEYDVYIREKMAHGFNSSVSVPGPNDPYDPTYGVIVEAEVMYYDGFSFISPSFTVILPSLPALQKFIGLNPP